MAYRHGDWIAIRLDLYEDPAVLTMAETLECHPDGVVGHCVRFWSWVSRNTDGSGKFSGFSPKTLGAAIGLNGFPELLIEVGWLKYSKTGKCFTIPNYERWLAETAKKRLSERDRKRTDRGQTPDKPRTNLGQNADGNGRISFEKTSLTEKSKRGGANQTNAVGRSGSPPPRQGEGPRGSDASVDALEQAWQRRLRDALAAGDEETADQLRANPPGGDHAKV